MSAKLSVYLVCVIISVNLACAVGIGVSPGKVQFEQILKEGYAERTVTVSTNSDEEVTAHLEVGGEINEMVMFEPNSTQFSLSKSRPYKLKVIAQPPPDARTGNYSGTITFVADGVGSIGGRAGGIVKAAINMAVSLHMTNEKRSECSAGAFELRDIEVNYPLELSTIISNKGNVRVKPVISVDVWDQMQQELLMSKKIAFDEVLPTTEKRIFKTIRNNLKVGQYWANIAIDECGAGDLLTFSVVERGGIADKGVLNEISNKGWVTVGETAEIAAKFQNLGERAVYAKFKGNIMLEDKIVKVVETEETEVPKGEAADFKFYFTPDAAGRYTISGRVIYNKKLSFEKNSILNANPPETQEKKTFGNVLPLVIYLVIIITIIFIVRKIIKEKKKDI